MAKKWLEELTPEELQELNFELQRHSYRVRPEVYNTYTINSMLEWVTTRRGRAFWEPIHNRLLRLNPEYGFNFSEYRRFLNPEKYTSKYIKEPKNVKSF